MPKAKIKARKARPKGDPFGAGPANFLKASTRRNYGASPTNYLLPPKKRAAGKPPTEPVSP